MGMAILAFVLSAGAGIWLSFFNQGMGVVASVSIIGAFHIYQNEANKKKKRGRIRPLLLCGILSEVMFPRCRFVPDHRADRPYRRDRRPCPRAAHPSDRDCFPSRRWW